MPRPGSHPVHFAGTNHLVKAEAVPMHDLAREQIRDRRQADVRMRTHVDPPRQIRGELHRTHVIEEHERADHAALRPRQHAPDLEAAQIAATRFDHQLDRGVRTHEASLARSRTFGPIAFARRAA